MNDSYTTKYNRILLGIKEKKVKQLPPKKKEQPLTFKDDEFDP